MCVLVEAAGPAVINAVLATQGPHAGWPIGSRDLYHQGIEEIEKALLTAFKEDDPRFKEIECPLKHSFEAPGTYLRTIEMPAGSIILGAEHLTTHWNFVWRGRAQVMIDGVIEEIVGPCAFVSKAGIRKVLYILETMTWSTLHVTDLTDPEEIEFQITKTTATIKQRYADT